VTRVEIPYGRTTIGVEVPDGSTVVEPTHVPALPDPAGAVTASLQAPVTGSPLGEIVGPGDRVVVVIPDHTRPMPHRVVLPPLLAELERVGAGADRVAILCATGTHRPADSGEMDELLGPEVVDRYPVLQHRADVDPHTAVGTVDGVPVLLDARYVAADVRITTGFVEPHFFAGFSGGPKGVCPGLAATETILEAHSARRVADPRSTWLVTEGNPVHDFVRAATALCPPTLSVDVTTNRRGQVTGVFTGPLPDAHDAACRHVEEVAVVPVMGRFPVVITTNGGHPLDRNLYQSVKGMAAAERVVADGGTIVMAAACGDGVPDGGAFARILAASTATADLAWPTGPPEQDRWQAQVLGRVLGRAEVWLHSDGLSDEQIRTAGLRAVPDLQAAVDEAIAAAGPRPRVCVLVHGPLAVASAR
jgi:nickel-dependent lactate racemase